MTYDWDRPGNWNAWRSSPIEIASKLQRPLPDGELAMVDAPPEAS